MTAYAIAKAVGCDGLVTATIDELRRARANQVSCCRDGILPLRRRFGSEGPQRGPGDEVALKIERVVDGGMDTEEALRGSSCLEPLNLALASSHRLMGVLHAIVLPQPLLMTAGQAQVPESRSVGAELVGSQQCRRETLFLEELAHQLECCALVAPALNQHVENLALVINCAPQVHPFASNPDYHLVEVPYVDGPLLARDFGRF